MTIDIENVLRHSGVMGTNIDDLDLADVPAGAMAQYGVKGQRWGVRNDDKLKGRTKAKPENTSSGKTKSTPLSKTEKSILKKAGLSEKDSARLQDKYGSGTLSKEPKPRLTPKQKKILIGLGVGVASAAAVVGAVFIAKVIQTGKANELANARRLVENALYNKRQEERMATDFANPANWGQQLQTFLTEYNNTAMDRNFFDDEDVAKLGTSEFFIKAGEALKRVSTEEESTIRPGGFYAAFKNEDVERYKAVLPLFWPQWGKDVRDGHVVNLVANKDIRVPSEKMVFDLFKDSLDDVIEFENPFLGEGPVKRPLKNLFPEMDWDGDNFENAKAAWNNFVMGWVDSDSPINKHFFSKLKSLGFDAVVDSNDAGGLAETPLRILDGSIFSIAGYDALPAAAIKAAQTVIETLRHAILLGVNAIGGEMTNTIEAILRHSGVMGTSIADLDLTEIPEGEMAQYGVLGQKWGVRRSENQLRRARGDISEDFIVSRKNKKKPVKTLSNAQLKSLNERLQLERTNNDLQSRSALAKIKKGTAVAGTILAVGTTLTAAYNFSQTPLAKSIIAALDKDKKTPEWLF